MSDLAKKYQPLNDYVLVQREDAQKKTSGGILIPDTSLDKPKKGVVVAVSEKEEKLKIGDRVVFGPFAGIETNLDEGKFVVLPTKDILLKVK